jgi:hypothetical protein
MVPENNKKNTGHPEFAVVFRDKAII